MNKEISKVYNPSTVEDKIYKAWEDSGLFNPDKLPGARKEAFTISMPPPNATGVLHIGHAMFLTIQDVVTRFQRMLGKKILWLPGTDHAAIATQTKVEKILKDEGRTKYDLGRERFIKQVDDYIRNSQHTIRMQMRKMGSSCDWSRERYTLDQDLSYSVRYAFVQLYKDGLIYRGERVVNWCPRCESTLADDEVEYREEKTKLYYFRYGPVVIGTARPETKFLDKTIVVHPKDKRYHHLIGKKFEVDWIGGKIQSNVIADPIMDMNFGTGAMTITPAHSFEDFDLAQKHHLPIVKIIDEVGNFTQAAGKYAGRNARACREEIVQELKGSGLLDRVEDDYVHNLSVCYRCETPVEPLPKDQWWVDVNKEFPISNFQFPIMKKKASLKELAVWAVKSGQIEIIPKRFEKIYFHWMDNLRDWCISRQIWFGHRIPVWYRRGIRNQESGIRVTPTHSPLDKGEKEGVISTSYKLQADEIYVGVEPPKRDGWEQDPDTLDTWFSSGLWTFSSLGWPNKTRDLKTFHPTSLMETGYDIIFFWVARMIILSNYFMKEVPFRQVYLHGLVRDEQGRKMSKSLENIIDPLDVIPKYGTDAIRLSLLVGTTPGNDINLGESKMAGYRNFVNKLWNISRYILMTVKDREVIKKSPKPKTLADKWILRELKQLIFVTTHYLNEYNFSLAGETLYEFTWYKLADWYLEITKIEKDKDEILLYILKELLKLWHPFCPFITENLWSHLSNSLLMIEEWPRYTRSKDIDEMEFNFQKGRHVEFELIQEIITSMRNIRAEYRIDPKRNISAIIFAGKKRKLLHEQSHIIKSLARVGDLQFVSHAQKIPQSAALIISDIEISIPLSGIIDMERERKRIEKDIESTKVFLENTQQRLNNKEFVKKASRDVVVREKDKLIDLKEKLKKLEKNLQAIL